MDTRAGDIQGNKERQVHRFSLFSRLLLYFILIMMVPIVLISIYYAAIGNRTMTEALKIQSTAGMDRLTERYAEVIDTFRHKAYVLSNDSLIISLLSDDNRTEGETSAKSMQVYETLFDLMRGSQSAASAVIVSNSGNVRYSTHAFPALYDRRYNNHDGTNPFLALERRGLDKSTYMTIANRYINESNAQIGLNIQRQVYDTLGQPIGFAVVDVFTETLYDLNNEALFKELVLIDMNTFLAASLTHPEQFGDFSLFPPLSALQSLTTGGTYVADDGSIVSLSVIPNTTLRLVGIVDTHPYLQNIRQFFLAVVLVFAIGLVVAGILAYFFSRSIARPVDQLVKSMKIVETGFLDVQVHESKILEFAQLDESFNKMVQQITFLLQLTQEEEEKLREAERKALESQMNPHFLYNTLNTIKALAKLHGESDILTITTKLGKLLRDSVDNRESEATLEESFALVDSYLTIQQIRFGEKLHVTMDISPEVLQVKAPKLLVQPLVENAIIHGLEPKVGEWNLTIRAMLRDGMVRIVISDNGVGFPPDAIPQDLNELADSTHVGVYNVYRRIKLKYGEQGSLRLRSVQGMGSIAILTFPAMMQKGERE